MPDTLPISGGTSTTPEGSSRSEAPAAPAPVDLADDTLVRVKGSETPIKFSDHVKGFQAQWTKAAQKAATLEKTLHEREARIQQYEQELARRSQPQGGEADVYAALRALPYLSGEDAVQVVEALADQFKQRDGILLGTLRQLQRMQQIVGGLHEASSSSTFDAKIAKWLQDGGYPPEAADLAKEVYLAYEGDDLDEEFPKIFEARFQQVEKMIEARRQAKVGAHRKAPFLPGKGGDATPSKPLEIKANASSKEIADLMWDTLQEGPET